MFVCKQTKERTNDREKRTTSKGQYSAICVTSSRWNINMKLCKHILLYWSCSARTYTYLQNKCAKNDWLEFKWIYPIYFTEINWMDCEVEGWENVAFSSFFFSLIRLNQCSVLGAMTTKNCCNFFLHFIHLFCFIHL